MQEEKLENLLLYLANPNRNEVMDKQEINANEKDYVELMLTYFKPSYAETAMMKIKAMEVDKQKNILRNLMSLYPLSQSWVAAILRGVENSETELIKGYDYGEKVFDSLKELLKKMEKNTGRSKSTQRFDDYKKDIDNLDQRIKELEKEVNNNKAYNKEIDKRNKRIAELEDENDETKRKQKLEDLDEKIRQLEDEKEKLATANKERKDFYDKLRSELQQEQNAANSEAIDRQMRELLRLFPDGEGDKA